MKILDLYDREKQNFLDNCVQCGLCAEECPILPYTEIGKLSAQEIQENVSDFIKTGKPNQLAYSKAFACMECFKCTADLCPEDLNPMLVNELIQRRNAARKHSPGSRKHSGFSLRLQKNNQAEWPTECTVCFLSWMQRLFSTGKNPQCLGYHGCYR